MLPHLMKITSYIQSTNISAMTGLSRNYPSEEYELDYCRYIPLDSSMHMLFGIKMSNNTLLAKMFITVANMENLSCILYTQITAHCC